MIARRTAHELRNQVLGRPHYDRGVFAPDGAARTLRERTVLTRDDPVGAVLGLHVDAYRDLAVVESADAARAFAAHALPGIVGAGQERLDRIRGQYSTGVRHLDV